MGQFDVHKWNKQRRESMLNEGFASDVIRSLKQAYRDFKINSKGEDRETMSRLNYLMDIIEKAYDLYDLQAIDQKTLDGIINKYGKMFQDEIDNSSDSFIKYTDFERSTDEPLNENSSNELHKTAFHKLADAYEIAEDTNMFDRLEMVMFTKLMNKAYKIATGKDSPINPYGDVDNG